MSSPSESELDQLRQNFNVALDRFPLAKGKVIRGRWERLFLILLVEGFWYKALGVDKFRESEQDRDHACIQFIGILREFTLDPRPDLAPRLKAAFDEFLKDMQIAQDNERQVYQKLFDDFWESKGDSI